MIYYGPEDLFVQRESIRNDGTWYFVDFGTPKGQALLKAYQGETIFNGSRAKQRAERALAAVLNPPPEPYDYRCPVCGAMPTEPCWNRRKAGEPNQYPHKARASASSQEAALR